MSKNILSIVAVIASGLALVGVVYQYYKTPKIAFVKSKELFDGYLGTKEAKAKYSKSTDEMSANVDTLTQQFNKSLADFNSSYQKLSSAEREEKKRLLSYQKENLDKYREVAEGRVAEEDQKLTQGVLNQVNTFINEYGKRKGYSIIYGTNLTGNIIYGDESYDLTNEVLAELNKHYKAQPEK